MVFLHESLEHMSSWFVYCLPLALRFILIGIDLFGLRSTLNTCFPVHNFMGCGDRGRLGMRTKPSPPPTPKKYTISCTEEEEIL